MINQFKQIPTKRIGACALILFHFSLSAQINCDNDTTFLIPLVDLQTGYYSGYQGGLYPGGVNVMPLAHADSGIAIAGSILPINNDGEEDTVYGKLAMVALGTLDAGKIFNKFVTDFNDAGYSDSCFKIVNACFDYYGLEDMISPSADDLYWGEVNDKLQNAGAKKKQVQIVWLMATSFDDTTIALPMYIDTMKKVYTDVIRKLKEQFFNLKLVYISGLHYGGYTVADADHYKALAEPAPYYNDIAIKSVIEAQITGDSSLNYWEEDADTPWIAWGPNVWADGRNARVYDGLRWMCPGDFDTEDNGYTLDGTGQQKIADDLFEFFTTEPTALPWIFGLGYGCLPDTSSGVDSLFVPAGEIVWISPNPAKGVVKFTINLTTNGKADVAVYNLTGEKIKDGSFFKIEPGREFTIKLNEEARGMYILSVLVDGRVYNVPFYLDT